MQNNSKKQHQHLNGLMLPVSNDLTVQITPHPHHEFLMTTAEVAHGYDCSTEAIRSTLSRNSDEFIEGKHFLKDVTFSDTLNALQFATHKSKGQQSNLWTKRGIVRLGFFLKTGRAKLFRDWAEDLIVNGAKRVSLRPDERQLLLRIKEFMVLGDVKAVAEQLGLTPKHVSAVKSGRKRSKNVLQALVDRANHNKINHITSGYPVAMVQQSLLLFNA